jgi:hypothetical protein
MIKRALILLVVVLLPLTVLGGDLPDRDVLLTSDGTLYTVESVSRDDVPSLRTISQRVLMLTVQKGATSSITAVPASLSGGWNGYPSLAYDPQSNTLFIFWQTALNSFLTSDLLVCSYQNGTWGVPTSLDNVSWAVRENLHIALTRRTEVTAADGSTTSVPEITVHAVWWQQDSSTQWARYAMLTMENGNVSSIQIRNVSDFLSAPDAPADKPVDSEILRHPVILESTAHDTVDVVYGDVRSGKMHRVTLKPVANGRLRIPIGVRDGSLPTPDIATIDATTSVSALPSSGGDGLALYFASSDSLSYLLYRNGAWSPARSIALNEKLTYDSAVEALRRMVNSE